MGMMLPVRNLDRLDPFIESMLRTARIPGAAIVVVAGDETIFEKGYGYRDLEDQLPMTEATVYPIGSTTKAINATLLGMLIEEGRLAWDAPVQTYLPQFRLRDPLIGTQVTVRDLVVMRTGLPRHDWAWIENPTSREDLVLRMRHLEPSAPFRSRFQYNNLTVMASGHIAEVVTGTSWEELVLQRILEPLQMRASGLVLPAAGNVTQSYHEDVRRELRRSRHFATETNSPAGGAIHSTVQDMARWLSFNLQEGKSAGHPLIQPQTLAEIHSPQMITGTDPSAPTPNAAYAMGWFVDIYNGCVRLSHGGYLRDVNSEAMLFPKQGIGIVAFINFGPPSLTRIFAQRAFDLLMGLDPVQSGEEKLAAYEKRVADTRRHIASVRRVAGTAHSHDLDAYAGIYSNPGYGQFEILRRDRTLILRRNNLMLPLEHWHYDTWVVAENDLFEIHKPHAFDAASRFLFEADADGNISTFAAALEPAVAPIRFVRSQQ